MDRSVAVIAFPGISPFHLSVPSLVFGQGEPGGRARYRVTICAEEPGTLPSSGGYDIAVAHSLDAAAEAGTVVMPSWVPDRAPSRPLLDAIRAAHERGARIVGLCLGAFPIVESGILDGREAATHWHAAGELARRYPRVRVRSDVLWSDLGDVVTSAGTAAALDCCLHLVRSDLGAAAATELARRLVLAPHRSGSQAQFIPLPVRERDGEDVIERAMAWARLNLSEPVDLDHWSREVLTTRRTFTRQFRERTGVSPQQWLIGQRLDRARVLLETTDLSVDSVAGESGFGSPASLRLHFGRVLGTSPSAHRELFATR
ncbi:helix-turn-helix domain-containing protein [Rhodococcus spelaei]|uniref:Helix-turn-helix domain-containing protein n=1 Tax=Rhodococcus spelaei TaxID=2546320 RepID=A0A541BRQ3_9NOCA|nr:helix-turn-helix domain-containing protein [Rhodococcus spelaei]TQF74949.1 helix-turn-helix domain-containing protein [Rhodococcus spelaei]